MADSDAKPVIVHALAGAAYGGAENFYTRLVAELAAQGSMEHHAFTRANAEREARLSAAHAPIQHFRFGSPLRIDDRWRYRQALKRLAPDLVLTYMNRASVRTPRGDYVLGCRLGHYYDLKYYRHADFWVGISRGICRHMIDGGLPAKHIYHIPNFADETPQQPVARDAFDTPTDRPLLLAAGRLHTNKAFDVLLEALTRVPAATLWLAGDGPERLALQDQARRLGLTERIRWLGWRNDVGALMQAADLFVCPSRHEGLGSIVMESWLAGCPIVATDSQGPGEAITDGETGLLTPVDQPQPLATAINRVLNEPALAAGLRLRASAHYANHYSAAVISRRYLELFSELLGR